MNEDDFKYGFTNAHQALMGYSALNSYCDNTNYEPFESNSSTEVMEPVEVMQEYLDKIVQLCNENNIDLILVKTPSTAANIKKYNYLNQYATEHNIQYIDFNEKAVYSEMGYNFATDNHDGGHLNIWGARKVSNYIGDVLVNQYNINTGESAQHEQLLEYYAEIKKGCELRTVTDFYEYLDWINDPQYVVFISIKDEGTAALDDELKEKLAALGATVDFNDAYRYSYYAVINGDADDEEIKDDELSSNGTIRNGVVMYEISSAGYENGNKSSIIIDGTEYSKNLRGMNIVVYSLITHKVIDAVCFDTCEGLVATR
ncbi:MAG: hypothetical protein LUC98_06095 [Lachnospiraceae bacterium]|nr:hypothetical protein [Lachnospiraceae bacterium]